MNRLLVIAVFLLPVVAVRSQTQDKKDFKAFAKAEKTEMLKAYGRKDLAGFRKHLGNVTTAYEQLSADDKKKFEWETWNIKEEYYLLADLYAIKGDKKNSLDYLEKSENYDPGDLTRDHDLDALRKEPRFIRFLDSAKKNDARYLTILRRAANYNTNENGQLPPFSYQSADDPNLKALKATYNLDSIAGKGNDVSQIINLMEWVHYLVPHDGSKGNPEIKNAMSLITECKRDHKTLNCRGLAILLNEVYLAEGFKSRYVTCLPKDTADQDCHVITMVWSKTLQKWLWMDPTFMAYIMDEKGALLSIEEVRERLISNKPLILNPDANRNHETSQTKNDYLENYMAKNLYRLECALSSEYNYETSEEGKKRTYIELLPGNVRPATTISNDKHGMAVYEVYYTNNPRMFWAAPTGVQLTDGNWLPVAAYERVMERFRNFYNEQRADSINQMFINPERMKRFLDKKQLQNLTEDYGKMISCKYMAMDNGDNNPDVALFKIVCEKSVHVMGISLDENSKLGTFRFATSSPYIDKLLAKEL